MCNVRLGNFFTYFTLTLSLGGQLTFFFDFNSMISTPTTTTRDTAISETMTNAAANPVTAAPLDDDAPVSGETPPACPLA